MTRSQEGAAALEPAQQAVRPSSLYHKHDTCSSTCEQQNRHVISTCLMLDGQHCGFRLALQQLEVRLRGRWHADLNQDLHLRTAKNTASRSFQDLYNFPNYNVTACAVVSVTARRWRTI